jgi:hypothetical protein
VSIADVVATAGLRSDGTGTLDLDVAVELGGDRSAGWTLEARLPAGAAVGSADPG